MNIHIYSVICGLLCLAGAGYEAVDGMITTDMVTDGLCRHQSVFQDRDGGFASSLAAFGRSYLSQETGNGPTATAAVGDHLVISESEWQRRKEPQTGCIFGADPKNPAGSWFSYRSSGILSGEYMRVPGKELSGWFVNASGIMQAGMMDDTGETRFRDRLSLVGRMNGWYRATKDPGL